MIGRNLTRFLGISFGTLTGAMILTYGAGVLVTRGLTYIFY